MPQAAHAATTPNELAARWQAIGQEWSNWYAKAASMVVGGAATPSFSTMLPAVAGALPTFDAQQLAGLSAKYQAQWQALWTAALGGGPQLPTAMPEIVPPAAGDRRFAAAEWRELPY